MDEEEHEVYGGEIPDEGEMEGDMDSHHADVDMSAADDDAVKVSSLSFVSDFLLPSSGFYRKNLAIGSTIGASKSSEH
jgi:hypothetical protein